MAKIIGLIYGRDENWIAGSYYIENLVSALNLLPENSKPRLKIYTPTETEFKSLADQTGYPSLEWIKLADNNTSLDKTINKISYIIAGKHLIARGIDKNVDLLFPASNSFHFDQFNKKLFWIPDFQEKHYPALFPQVQKQQRKHLYNQIVKNQWPVVFSSVHAENDFKQLFPSAKNKTFVMPFAVTLPSLTGINSVVEKYQLDRPYFICSNQFWAHKNHQVVLKAVDELKKRGHDMLVVFTGKAYDNRNPDYYRHLEEFVSLNNLTENIRFLGFINRLDQLQLIKNSIGILQPSLFEGWSTIVEDGKALNVPMIVSDIPVHREQLGAYPYLFDKHNARELADKMMQMKESPLRLNIEYQYCVRTFGEKFMEISKSIAQ